MPKAKGYPLVGPLPNLIANSFDFFLKAQETYGDIYLLDVGLMQTVVCNHPRHIRHVYVTKGQSYRKAGALWEQMKLITGNGLAVSEGDTWRRQRTMLQPVFNKRRLRALGGLMSAAVSEELPHWRETIGRERTMDVSPLFARTTMKMTIKLVFGTSLHQDEIDKVQPELQYAVRYLLPAMLADKVPHWIPIPGRRRYRQAIDTLGSVLMDVIARRRGESGEEGDLIAQLSRLVDESGQPMSQQQLLDETLTLFLAGYETTANAITWAAHFLSQHSEVMDKLHGELDAVLGGRIPTYEDLAQLTYTNRVFRETLRLCPPIWWNPRDIEEEDEIDGFYIPPGTTVTPVTYVIQRHPEFWEQPHVFDPDRFTPERSEGRDRYAWAPFGYGRRSCIGQEMAMMEGVFILAGILQHLQIEPIPGREAKIALLGTLRPKNGVHLRLRPRHGGV
ncbi:cytochrome P450 [Haliangium ochraceum]|uniref:Cytochrome P450 n=1 Tax=Haliangium ochraceum (strain DSM 14365 / JCM 11303 / SMP-2) TaxID=502025 RepID=D0LP63_HALO1|nr:cytochrome P450 [Haliangium ochraceum]ACY13428.1 cytochrome P450 [Haliangium ochraceum DSM 14365]